MATRKGTKTYVLSDLVDNCGLVHLSEDKLTDDNDSDTKSCFSDSEFEKDTNTIAHLQPVATVNTSHNTVQSADNTSNISTSDVTFNDFSEPSRTSNSVTLNKESLPVRFVFAVRDRVYNKDYGHKNK